MDHWPSDTKFLLLEQKEPTKQEQHSEPWHWLSCDREHQSQVVEGNRKGSSRRSVMSTSHQSSNSSQLLGDQRAEPAAPATSLNDRLQAQHTDVPEDDDSIQANLVRSICQVRSWGLGNKWSKKKCLPLPLGRARSCSSDGIARLLRPRCCPECTAFGLTRLSHLMSSSNKGGRPCLDSATSSRNYSCPQGHYLLLPHFEFALKHDVHYLCAHG